MAVLLVATGCDKLFSIDPIDLPEPDSLLPTTRLVQEQSGSHPNASTLDLALAAPPTNGNVLVMIGATDRDMLVAPSGGGVTSWVLAQRSLQNQNIEVWYGVSDQPGDRNSTVTITCASSPGYIRISLTEWSGLATTNLNVLGAAARGSTTGSELASTPAIMPPDTPALLLFGIAVLGTASASVIGTPGTWTALRSIPVGLMVQSQWYQLDSDRATYMPGTMVDGSWEAVVVALRAQP